jgi:uncharacterized membrane protein
MPPTPKRVRGLFDLHAAGAIAFDAAVIEKAEDGEIHVRKTENPTQHGARQGSASARTLFLLWLAFIAGINDLGQVLRIAVVALLALVGVEILRRHASRDFPARPSESNG